VNLVSSEPRELEDRSGPRRVRRFEKKEECEMKATVTDDCTGCGLCVDSCPDVFEMADDVAVVKADPVPPEAEECAKQAADDCPSEAIKVE
jgi:ferredoxin